MNALLSSISANNFLNCLYSKPKDVIPYINGREFGYKYKGGALYVKLSRNQLIMKCICQREEPELLNDPNNWRDATCTVKGVRAINHDVRKAWISNNSFSTSCEFLYNFLYNNKLEFVNNNIFQLIKYDSGCFAGKHVDSLGDFTCLIFLRDQECTGGELVIYDWFVRGGRTVFDPSGLIEDVIVIFPTNLTHEVLPVKSGTRYVYKTGLKHNIQKTVTPKRFNCNMD